MRSGCIGLARAVAPRPGSNYIPDMSLRTASLPEALKREVEKLSPEDRLLLAGALWDDIEAEFEIAPPELTPEHRAILEARDDEFNANPDAPRKSLDEILGKFGFRR